MTVIGHIPQEDLALYVMQLLDAEETRDLQHHLSECRECVKALGEISGDLAAIALTAEMHAPSDEARVRLLKQVEREHKVIPIQPAPEGTLAGFGRSYQEEQQKKRSGILMVFPYLGWVAAAALLFVSVSQINQRGSLQQTLDARNGEIVRLTAVADRAQQLMDVMNDASAVKVSLSKAGGKPAPMGRATYLPERGALVFVASNMEPLPPSKTYELWVIPANGTAPVPAGTFHPDAKGNANLVLPKIPVNVAAKAFGITIENEGGSQTPTLPIVMAGT